jgi:hypothetical protein
MADHFSATIQQMACKVETVRGTAETLTSADAKFRVFGDIAHALQHPRFTNEEIGDDLAAAADFVGGSQAGLSFGINLRSSGVLAGPHGVDPYLRGCGMRSSAVNAITIGAIAGGDTVFNAGESYSSAAGAKTGLIDETISSPGTMRYTILTGGALAAADVVTVGADSATASDSPRSSGQEAVTIQRCEGNSEGTAGQDSIIRLKGAMGSYTIDAAALDILKARFEFTGVQHYNGAGSKFTGVTYEGGTNAQLPRLQNSVMQVNGVTVSPDAFSFAINNQVEMDPDVTTLGGLDWFVSARISSREATISITPLRLLHSVLDEQGLLKLGSTFPFRVVMGVSPWQFELTAKLAQVRAAQPGTRAGLATSGLTIVCTRGVLPDDDFAIYFR